MQKKKENTFMKLNILFPEQFFSPISDLVIPEN